MVDYCQQRFSVSERRACRVVGIARAVNAYRSHRRPYTELRMRMREIAATRMRYGYRKIHVLLRREGYALGKHLMRRLYGEEGLTLRYKASRRRPRAQGTRPERRPVTRANAAWSLDFVADQLADGARFRMLTVIDVFTRECVAIRVGQRLNGNEVVLSLEAAARERGAPQRVYCDNGSEFTSQVFDLWAYRRGVTIEFSRPGKPTDNAFVESFNGTLRDECLNAHWFTSLQDAAREIEAWRHDYNASRPHRALGDLSPAEFARQHQNLEVNAGG